MRRKETEKFIRNVSVIKTMMLVVSWTTMVKWYRSLDKRDILPDTKKALRAVLVSNKKPTTPISNDKPWLMFNLPKTREVIENYEENPYNMIMPLYLENDEIAWFDIDDEDFSVPVEEEKIKSVREALTDLQNHVHFNINVFLDTGMSDLYDICNELTTQNPIDNLKRPMYKYKEIEIWDEKYIVEDCDI